MGKPKEINVCCPFFDLMDCGDTDEHRHIACRAKGGLINNSETVFKCISDYNWQNCEVFSEVLKD
jgi:hypothetical protein